MAEDKRPVELPDQVFVPVPTSPLTGVEVFPAEVQLTTARDRQSIVVQATFADGITRDVTKEATFSIADPKLLKRDGAIFRPAADGTTTADDRLRRKDGRRAGESRPGDRPASA